MSEPITFPIKAYRGVGGNIQVRIFEARESAYLSLNKNVLTYDAPNLYSDYGNEPEYYSTDVDVVKAMMLADLQIKYQKAVLGIQSFCEIDQVPYRS